MTSTYFSNLSTRFLIPSLPFFSLSIAMGIGEIPLILTVLMLVHAVLSWPSMITSYGHPYSWRLSGFPIREALRLKDQDAFLSEVLRGYPVARMIDKLVPPGEPVYSKDGVAEAYMEHELRRSFTSASNEVLDDTFSRGGSASVQLQIVSLRFPSQQGQRFRLEQIAEVEKDQIWNVHKLRFFHNGVELERKPQWELFAWPVPWEARLAFDDSPLTRWRSWETAKPGMYIGVDFGGVETVDEIRVEMTDAWQMRFQPQFLNPSGKWVMLPAQIDSQQGPALENARVLATDALRELGVNYILLYDRDYLADDVIRDPSAWRLQELGRAVDARIYKILPPEN